MRLWSHLMIDSIKNGDGKSDDKLLRPSSNQYAHSEREDVTYMAEYLETAIPWMLMCWSLITASSKLGTKSWQNLRAGAPEEPMQESMQLHGTVQFAVAVLLLLYKSIHCVAFSSCKDHLHSSGSSWPIDRRLWGKNNYGQTLPFRLCI